MNQTTKYIVGVVVIIAIVAIGWSIYKGQVKPVSNEVIKMGVVLPLTGSGAAWGEGVQKGMLLSMEKQGIPKSEIIFEDSQSKNDIAVSAANKLISLDKINILFSVFSGASVAVAKPASDAGILHMYSAGTIKPMKDYQTSVKAGFYNYEIEGKKMGELLKAKKIENAIFVGAKTEFAEDFYRGLKSSYPELKLQKEGYESGKDDFRTISTKIKEGSYQAIVISGYVIDYSRFFDAYNNYKLSNIVFCTAREDCLSDNLAQKAPIGTITFSHEVRDAYAKEIKAKYPDISTYQLYASTGGHDAVVIYSMLKKACPDGTVACYLNSLNKVNLNNFSINVAKVEGHEFVINSEFVTLNSSRQIEQLK